MTKLCILIFVMTILQLRTFKTQIVMMRAGSCFKLTVVYHSLQDFVAE